MRRKIPSASCRNSNIVTVFIQLKFKLKLKRWHLKKGRWGNASGTAGGRARLSSARRRTPSIAARRAEDRRALPAMTDRLAACQEPEIQFVTGSPDVILRCW